MPEFSVPRPAEAILADLRRAGVDTSDFEARVDTAYVREANRQLRRYPHVAWDDLNGLRPAIADSVAAEMVYGAGLSDKIPVEKMIQVGED